MKRNWFRRGFIAAVIITACLFGLLDIAHAAPTVCQIGNGCTGTSTAPAYGQVPIGGKNGEYEFVATSTLGGLSPVQSVFGRVGAIIAQTGDYTTSQVTEGSNLYFTNARAVAALTGQNVSIFTNDAGYLSQSAFNTAFDNRLSATTSLPKITTLAGLSLPYSQLTGTPLIASSTLLSDNNTFSGNDTFSSTITGSVSGNAGTATKLAMARNINNVPFDGTSNITVNAASSTALSDNNNFIGINAFTTITANSFNTILYVPAPGNYSATTCGGVATTTYSGCVSALYASASTSATHGVTIMNVYSATSTATVNFNINGLAVNFACSAGVNIGYNGPSGAYGFIINNGNPIGHPTQKEGIGCQFTGQTNGQWIAAAQTNTATTTGWLCGGTNGCVGIQFDTMTVNGFGTQIEFGANAYMYSMNNVSLSGGNGGINNNGTVGSNRGSLMTFDPASNSGERFVCQTCSFTDPGNSTSSDAVVFATSSVASAQINGLSLDDAQIYIAPSNGQIVIGPIAHAENSDSSQYGAYWPIWAASSQVTELTILGMEVANDATTLANSFPGVIKHGVNLTVDAMHIDCYGGQPVALVIDSSLNNGTNSESIRQVQAGSGGASCITNIVSNQAYSQAAGVGPISEVGNSYPFEWYIDSSNLVHARNGNQDVATVDSNGNWTLGGASGGTTLKGTLTEDGTGTSTFSGGISTSKIINVQSTTASSTFANGINLTAGCFSVNGTCLSSGGGGTVTGVTGTFPILSSGGAAPVISWGGISTSTNLVVGDLDYATGANTIGQVATSTLTPSSPLGGNFTVVGSGGTLTCTTCVISVSGTTNQITSSGGTTPALSLPNLVIFPNAASTTLLSVFNTAYFGGSSTTTISATGAITTPSAALDSFFNASTTNLTAATSLGIPTGSNPGPTAAGYIAQSTNSPFQLQVGNGGGTAVFDPRVSFTFAIATSTAWTGSTTAPTITIPNALTWNQISCTIQPGGATLEVGYQYANSSAYTSVFTYLPASTTPGVWAMSSNNAPTKNATSTITFGNPTGNPTSASCTLTGTISGV